jgi:predicted amidohydrolase YtcJ
MTVSPSVLYRGGRFFGAADPRATAMLVTGDRIGWLGASADAPTADAVVDLDGALVTPAFVDAHLHATDTGLAVAGLDLSAARSAVDVLDAVARFAAAKPGSALVHGYGWDESTWTDQRPPSAQELETAGGGRRVYLAQASVHSALCSTTLLAAAPAVLAEPGYDASGWVREQAHHLVRAVALGSLSADQRTAAQRTALARAAGHGIAAVHECGGPGTSSEDDFTSVLGLSGRGLPQVFGFWGELMAAGKARELGAVGAGGDLYADGALGSRTAHLSSAYLDGGGYGEGFVTSAQAADHLVDCAAHGMQGGFHAIGDAAIGTVLAGFADAARRLGTDRLRAGRHRIEHVELADQAMIAAMVRYGVVASVQPVFDRLWGGAGRMYEQRLGLARSLASNPLGAMHSVGVALAFGSDSPVTPLDPWGAVAAAATHANPAYRMSVRAGFAAHTRGGWRAAGDDTSGVLVPGAAATFAVWDTPAGVSGGLPVLVAAPDEPEPARPVCRRTVLHGETIFEE